MYFVMLTPKVSAAHLEARRKAGLSTANATHTYSGAITASI